MQLTREYFPQNVPLPRSFHTRLLPQYGAEGVGVGVMEMVGVNDTVREGVGEVEMTPAVQTP